MTPKKGDSYRENRENYKKNLAGHSNDTMGLPEEEDFGEAIRGRLVYSDIYTVGESPEEKSGGGGKKNRPVEKRMNQRSPRLLSAREFLDEYRKNGPADGDSSDSKKNVDRPNRRNRRKNPDSGSESSAESGNADKKRGKKGKNVGSEPGERGKAVGLRVIGGKFRAVRLEYSGDHRVRPMKDRIRESVFNLIGPLVAGKHVVDLFTGTGALAFEALSRGAASATLIEIHFPTARVTRNNIAALDAKEPGIAEKIDLMTTDVFFWGRTLSGEKRPKVTGIAPGAQRPLPTDIPWLVFCSPPYDFYIERQAELLELLESVRSAAPSGSVFVVEADERFDFDLLGVPIPPKKRKSYSPAEIALFTI